MSTFHPKGLSTIIDGVATKRAESAEIGFAPEGRPRRLRSFVLMTIVFLFAARALKAATYYVSPSGSDGNAGTQQAPWKTIRKAADTAVAGDHVLVKAGEYNEFVTMQHSGTAGSPIVFEGERGPNGEWLTIIDPSTDFSTGWVAAPEIGAGVYQKTDGPFVTRELLINNKRVAYVFSMGDMSSLINSAYINSGLATGAQVMALPPDTTLKTSFLNAPNNTIRFWDGVEALWGFNGNTTYLRFRDNRDPNGMPIKASPFGVAVTLQNKSHVIFRDFLVQGSFRSVSIGGTSSHHNVIENNRLINGHKRVGIAEGAYENIVRNNEMSTNYYGYDDAGAWGMGENDDPRFLVRAHLYIVQKFVMGGDSWFSTDDIEIIQAGSANKIYGNHLFGGLGNGIGIAGSVASPTQNTEIFDNVVEGHPSVGILLSRGQTGTRVYDNVVLDNNINLRFHEMDAPGETDRRVYVYRNKLWLPQEAGEHIYCHFWGVATTYHPEYWVYHNSFSGSGKAMLVVSSLAADFAGGTPGLRFLNNVISGTQYSEGNAGVEYWTDKGMLGVFDYNLITPPIPTYPIAYDPPWFGSHNIKEQAALWALATIPDFFLPSGSSGIDAGLDLSRRFLINNRVHEPLPGMASGYFLGSAPDIGAYEIGGTGRPPNPGEVGTTWIFFKNVFDPPRERAVIQFNLAESGHVSLIAYDRFGKKVRQILDGDFPAGPNPAEWDGRNDSGNIVASGVYVLVLKAGDTALKTKVVVVK